MEKVRKIRLTKRDNKRDYLSLHFSVSIVRDMGWTADDEFVAVLNIDKDMIAIARTKKGGKE